MVPSDDDRQMGRGWGGTEPLGDEHHLKLIYPDGVQRQQPFRLKENPGTLRPGFCNVSFNPHSFQVGKRRQRQADPSP